jgi:hypothetical protein
MNLHQEIAPSQVLSFPGCGPKKAADIQEMQLALKVALDALDVLEAKIPRRDALGFSARSGPAIDRFASRIAEGLSRARTAG